VAGRRKLTLSLLATIKQSPWQLTIPRLRTKEVPSKRRPRKHSRKTLKSADKWTIVLSLFGLVISVMSFLEARSARAIAEEGSRALLTISDAGAMRHYDPDLDYPSFEVDLVLENYGKRMATDVVIGCAGKEMMGSGWVSIVGHGDPSWKLNYADMPPAAKSTTPVRILFHNTVDADRGFYVVYGSLTYKDEQTLKRYTQEFCFSKRMKPNGAPDRFIVCGK
jgi:hypothetical protein